MNKSIYLWLTNVKLVCMECFTSNSDNSTAENCKNFLFRVVHADWDRITYTLPKMAFLMRLPHQAIEHTVYLYHRFFWLYLQKKIILGYGYFSQISSSRIFQCHLIYCIKVQSLSPFAFYLLKILLQFTDIAFMLRPVPKSNTTNWSSVYVT